MIVFWRLVLAYYLAGVLFYNHRFLRWKEKSPMSAYAVQAIGFLVLGSILCGPYLRIDWPLSDIWPVPGWVALLGLTFWYVMVHILFAFRTTQTHQFTRQFVLHELAMWGALFACAPLNTVYQTGNLMAEPNTLFCVGLLVVTKMFSICVYMVEMDLYGRDFPTLDESFVTMLMRLIFFLMILLPGWRWVIWVLVWLWACIVARKNRIMDLSSFALYFGAFGSIAVGFLIRLSWYGI